MATHNNGRLAVLIDADNAQASVIQELLAEVSRYGTATIKRAYGDWTTTNLKGWKDVLHKMAIQPVQQFSYTSGKNATDSALIIDAMDVLHTGRVDGFCLVSSDSDFTRLATRIREAGLVVYGFGERKTPEPFVAACDKFIYTEILRPEPEPAKVSAEGPALPPLKPMVMAALEAAAREDGWAALGPVGSLMTKNHPSFDPRNYGFSKLGELMRRQDYLEVKEVPMGDGSTNVHLHVRRRIAAANQVG
ncbi:MAG: NYN domain-containing protein [Comamonadaceae bacterium]|uniref:NYN domain-containing protein n=1 Tax=Candidatus Skiveiella danica TaxID=3386177 RepID=UPI00390A6F51|nr:NYN domain-containing protein [Comamonadaceae bacterium]